MSVLTEPLTLGALILPNRIVMSPLTRCRSGEDRIPNALMAEYYRQRASAGLIISEATSINPQAVGYENTPGIWTKAHVEGWKQVTKAVHDAGGRIVLQLWHVGRISDPCLLNGEAPVAPSAVKADGLLRLLRPKRGYVTPRALEISEIPHIVEAYRQAAENAKQANFDGVEIHAANGYLIDQFMRDRTNLRTDCYGGSVQNRARFLLEITDAVISVWGADRVGVHLSPLGNSHDMADSDPRAIFGHVASELGKRNIAFLFIRDLLQENSIIGEMKDLFGGPVIANDGISVAQAEEMIADGQADAIAFGRDYIATPDLVERIKRNMPFNKQYPDTFYTRTAEGYTDYPVMS